MDVSYGPSASRLSRPSPRLRLTRTKGIYEKVKVISKFAGLAYFGVRIGSIRGFINSILMRTAINIDDVAFCAIHNGEQWLPVSRLEHFRRREGRKISCRNAFLNGSGSSWFEMGEFREKREMTGTQRELQGTLEPTVQACRARRPMRVFQVSRDDDRRKQLK